MITISKDSKVYVICPASIATGGPELLHQFAHILREKGVNAMMYYTPSNVENPIHQAFEQYKVPFVREIEDNERNLLITCETYGNIKE